MGSGRRGISFNKSIEASSSDSDEKELEVENNERP